MTRIVVGVDAGGTSTRCLAVDVDGNRLGWSRGPGANLNSSADAEQALRTVLGDVVDPGAPIESLVVAAAGAGAAGLPRVTALASRATEGRAIARLIVHTDIEAAFAAGSLAPEGTVLVGGTGAVAARIVGFRIARRIDGHGYRLGDRGSAFWIGTRAADAVLAELDGHGAATGLTPVVVSLARSDPAVADRTDGLGDAEAIEAAVYANPPAWLGSLAPLVESVAATGDPVAEAIVDAAVAELVATARRAHEGGPLVVTGAVVSGGGVLGERVRAGLEHELGVAPTVVHDASVGAAALALRAVPGIEARVVAQLVSDA